MKIDDFDGLTPVEMDNILYSSFKDDGLILLNKDIPTSINVFKYDRNPDFKAGFHEGAYLNRVFRTFLKYIGAIEQKTTINKQEHTSINEARKTKLFDKIFTIKI